MHLNNIKYIIEYNIYNSYFITNVFIEIQYVTKRIYQN